MNNKLWALCLPLLMVACAGNHSTNNSTNTLPLPSGNGGELSFSAITTTSAPSPKMKAAKRDTGSTVFDFGNMPSTQTYLFELKNTGSLDVDNVSISTDNPSVAICTPSNIGVLPTQGTGGVVPLLEVQVLHGVGQNNYGLAPTLPMGSFSFVLTANGTDTAGNAVVASCEVDLNVLVANFTLLDNNGNVVNSDGQTSLNQKLPDSINFWTSMTPPVFPLYGWWYGMNGSIQQPQIPDMSYPAYYQVQNTGNVDLTVNDLGNYYDTFDVQVPQTVSIPAGTTVEVHPNFNHDPNSLWATTWLNNNFEIHVPVVINPKNVVFDSSMNNRPDLDGNCYIAWRYYYTFPPVPD